MLKYQWLNDFDSDMVHLTKEHKIFQQRFADLRLMKAPEQMLAFSRQDLLFVFNFHFENSLTGVLIPVKDEADYVVEFSSDDEKYGGWNQVQHITYPTKVFDGQHYVELYIPARTAIVLREIKKVEEKKPAKKAAAKKPAAKKTTKKAEKTEA
jgi:1,4-alpha-glucan branching enzyme